MAKKKTFKRNIAKYFFKIIPKYFLINMNEFHAYNEGKIITSYWGHNALAWYSSNFLHNYMVFRIPAWYVHTYDIIIYIFKLWAFLDAKV